MSKDLYWIYLEDLSWLQGDNRFTSLFLTNHASERSRYVRFNLPNNEFEADATVNLQPNRKRWVNTSANTQTGY